MSHEVSLGEFEGPLGEVVRQCKNNRMRFDEFKLWLKSVTVCLSVSFAIWKTIKLGTGLQSADEFRGALKNGGFRIGSWGDDVLGKPAFKVATKEIEVDLVNVSVAELGFKNGATRADIYKKALSLGLELCPNEVGPQLRLQYKDQPKGEWLLVAMEPITDSDGRLCVFSVERGGDGLWLSGSNGRPDYFWNGSNRFVFVRRK